MLTAPRGGPEGACLGRAAAAVERERSLRTGDPRSVSWGSSAAPPGPAHATIALQGGPLPRRPSAPGSRDAGPPSVPRRSRWALPAPRSGARPRATAPAPERGVRSYLSPQEPAGAAPGRPSPCGPGGPPVTPAPSLVPAPDRPRPAPVTPWRQREGGGRRAPHFRPGEAAAGRRPAEGGK